MEETEKKIICSNVDCNKIGWGSEEHDKCCAPIDWDKPITEETDREILLRRMTLAYQLRFRKPIQEIFPGFNEFSDEKLQELIKKDFVEKQKLMAQIDKIYYQLLDAARERAEEEFAYFWDKLFCFENEKLQAILNDYKKMDGLGLASIIFQNPVLPSLLSEEEKAERKELINTLSKIHEEMDGFKNYGAYFEFDETEKIKKSIESAKIYTAKKKETVKPLENSRPQQ